MTHTPSPWTTGRAYSSTGAVPIRWKGENLAWACGADSAHEFSREQAAANAKLISAAPEMYAILKACVTQHSTDIEERGNATRRLDFISRMAQYATDLADGKPTQSPI